METYESLLAVLALTMGVSWASGINLYATLFILGLGGSTGNIDLPTELMVLEDPMVIGAAGIMYLVEFFVDKVPGVDSGWDTIHTFIRIPAGAMLAAGSVGDVTPAMEIAAGILGGGVSATSHATKSGTRLLLNTTPEPVSNWSASIGEDVLVIAGLWAALQHPEVFLVLFVIFIILAIWLLPKLWYLIKTIFHRIGKFFGWVNDDAIQINHPDTVIPSNNQAPEDAVGRIAHTAVTIEELDRQRADGSITEEEYQRRKREMLDDNKSQNSD